MTDSSAEQRRSDERAGPVRLQIVASSQDRTTHRDERSASALAELLEPAARAIEEAIGPLARMQADAVRTRFGSYRVGMIPEESLIESGHRNVGQVLAALRAGRPPDRAELDDARRARERMMQGVPADELHDAYRMCLRILGEQFITVAHATGIEESVVLAGTRLLWDTADVLTSVVVTARQEAELDFARHDERQRIDFLRSLVFDASGQPELRQRSAAFGLPLDRSYWAVRAHAADAGQRDELRSTLDAMTRTYGCRPLLGVIDGDVIGVVPVLPSLSTGRFTVGVGGPAPLEAMPRAFATASRMLDVAIGFGLSGSFQMSDLSLRVAVASEPELGALLVTRYIAPLQSEGEYGAVLEDTVIAHIACGSRIKATANRLDIHTNTVRHRLAKFEELTGARLDDPDVVLELWWTFTWRSHGHHRHE